MDLGLSGKSVVVTGGGSNIGRAITLGFAAEGANITVGEIDLDQGARVVEQARAAGAASADVIRCDVSIGSDVDALFTGALEAHGAVDILVNNVGWDQLMFFTQTTPELWEKIISTLR